MSEIEIVANGEYERLPLDAMNNQTLEPLVEEHINRYRFCSGFISGKKVLDAACGIGFGAYILAEAGAKSVDAFDISSEAIDTAQRCYRHPKINFEIQDILSLSTLRKYDVIISFETMEHISDPEKYLQIMHDVLNEDGLFFVSTPNRRVTNPEATRFDKPNNPFHVFELILEELIELLSKRFEIFKIYEQHPYYYKGTKIRTLESILMSRRLHRFLHLSEANYRKRMAIQPLRRYIEPRFFVVQCRKRLS